MKRSNFMSYLLHLATNYQFIVELKQRFEQQSEWREKKKERIEFCMESDSVFFSFSSCDLIVVESV